MLIPKKPSIVVRTVLVMKAKQRGLVQLTLVTMVYKH